jgi:hypothetical protein
MNFRKSIAPMIGKTNHEVRGKFVGYLPDNEKQIIIKNQASKVQTAKIVFVMCACFFFLILTIPVAIIAYSAIRKTKERLKMLESTNLKIYSISGSLNSKRPNMGSRMMIDMVDDFLLPELLNPGFGNSRKDIGKKATVEYLPEAWLNRLYIDSNGRGYNYITKTAITN